MLAALQGTTLQQDPRAVTSVEQVSMILTLILLLHARAAVRASTLQRGRHLAVTVRQDTVMKTVTQPRNVWPAVRVGMQLQEAHYVATADLVVMITIQILRVRV